MYKTPNRVFFLVICDKMYSMCGMDDLFGHLLILRSPGIGPVAYEKLLRRFGSVDAVIESLCPPVELRDAVMR